MKVAANTVSADVWNQRGLASFELKNFDGAAECYREALRVEPNSPVALSNLAYVYLVRRRFAEAKEFFNKALLKKPELPAAREGLCFISGVSEDTLQETQDTCGKALVSNHDSAAANYFLGLEYLGSGQNGEALKFLERARDLEPQTPRHYIVVGEAQVRLKKFEEALQSFRRAETLQPGLASAYMGEGTVYFLMRKRGQAIRSLRRAIEIDPDLAVAHFNLGIACLAQNRRDCALQQYNALKIMDSSMAKTLFRSMFGDRLLDVRVRN